MKKGRKLKYDHINEGRNSRLDSIQAAILTDKLKKLNDWIDHRNKIALALLPPCNFNNGWFESNTK